MKKDFNYFNSRITSILFLGFSSGLPLGLVSSTLQAWYTVSGASLITIGWLTLVGQPYVFKFLWAPVLDRFVPGKIGRRRSWILLMQIGLGMSLMTMAFLNPISTPWVLGFFGFLTAVFSATQDIGIDAYRTELLTEKERGFGVSIATVAYRIAMIVSTAFALLIAAKIGWRAMYLVMSGIFFALSWVTIKSQSPAISAKKPSTLKEAVIAPSQEFFSRKNALLLLVFIVIYKLCDAMALSLNTTFLIRGVGFSLMQIGTISKMVGLVASLLGSIIGGLLMPRFGLYRGLLYFGFLQMISNLLYAWLAVVGKSMIVMSIAIFGEYFCGGLATVAFIVFLMGLCDRRYTATQYALFSAVATIGRIFIGPISAMLVKHWGWVEFYVWTTIIGLPALAILWRLKHHITLFTSPEPVLAMTENTD